MSFRSRAILATIAFSLACACTQTPELVLEHTRRGDALLAEGRYSQAIAAYNHARDLAPHDPIVQRALMRARVHSLAENPSRLVPEAIEEARYEAQLLLDIDKARAPVYLTAQGNILYQAGDVEGAKLKYAEALKIDPASPIAHTALGLVLGNRKDGLAQAKAEFETALKTKPDQVGALLGLGQVKAAEGDYPGAAERLEAALKISDDFATRMALGGVRVQQQKPGDAIEHFQRAVQLDSRSADALSSLGQALLGAGRAEEAERALRGATQLRSDESTLVALGFALVRQKKSEQALGIFTQVLGQNPSSATALYGAGTASDEVGRKDQALAYFRRLLTVPAEGAQKQILGDLQKDAASRIPALEAAVAAAAPPPTPSAVPSAGPAVGPGKPPAPAPPNKPH